MKRPSNEIVFRVAELFLEPGSERRSAEVIAAQVNRELRPEPPLTRESVYRLLAYARELEMIRLVPPLDRTLATRISERFDCPLDSLMVVNTADMTDNELVAVRAAEMAAGILRDLGRRKAPVGVGLGPGRATLDFCRHLAQLVASDPEMPLLRLVAITAGGPGDAPEFASTSFFNLFPRNQVHSQVGLFAETLVPCHDYAAIKARPGVAEAFAAIDDIDLVVTSMGDVNDDHDLLAMFLRKMGALEDLRRLKCVGNVQYRPFSADAPIVGQGRDLRAVTLFELEDLVQRVKYKDKHVLLIARQCGLCGRDRSEALRPLLTQPRLRVFSHVVMDVVTGKALLSGAGGPRGGED